MTKAKQHHARSLKLNEWSAADQQALVEARRPHGRLTRGGRAAHLKEVSLNDLVQKYGLYLDHVVRAGIVLDDKIPAGSVTPELVQSFVWELEKRVSTCTQAGYVTKLWRMAQLINPHRDLAWLGEIANDLALEMIPASKFERLADTDLIVWAGLTLMEEAETNSQWSPLKRAHNYRNGLMIALLALCPIRLKNLANLTLEMNFLKIGEHWLISLSADETKENRADRRPIPHFLSGYIERYIAYYRPVFGYQGLEFWVGRYGKPLGYSAVERWVTETTRVTLGISISPHLVRSCAASTAYKYARGQSNLASSLLNHRDPKTTREHYDRGVNASYVRDFGKLLDSF
jgi:integrase